VLVDGVLVGGVGDGLGDPFELVQAAANATITTNVRNRYPTAVIVAGAGAADQTLKPICGQLDSQRRCARALA
jgi:hypothetical protein